MSTNVAVLGAPRPAISVTMRDSVRGALGWLLAVEPGAASDVDPAVVARAQRGDVRAFTEIVEHHDLRLRALAFRLLGDRDRMDDALQDAYVKAFRSLPRFRGAAGVGTWLYRIVYNTCLDELRRGRVVVPLFGDDRVEPASPDPGPDDIAGLRHDLGAALADLPVDQRAAVLLVDAYGFDYSEAAAVLGVREGTIASRLSRARAALRLTLEAGTA